ncbi:MAG: UDP-N-acetylglucosamine 2-epimerase [Halioglobus sp.]|nr:UDP-N-acetylglucosamine 2-epimerase [Halioglobus sp.]
MIHVFIGTKAQLIKMAPVMVELQNRDIPYNFVFSGQHQATVANIRADFGIKDPDVTLYRGRDITGLVQMFFWILRIVFYTIRHRQEVWQGDRDGIVLNHGDTFSTLLGSLLARLCGLRSAHVESGLRSFKWFHPFPEELTRLLTFRLSNIYFAPGQWALSNLERYRGIKVDTRHNTLLDALRLSERAVAEADVEIPAGEFGLVSIHRFENIFSRNRFEQIVQVLAQVSTRVPLLFILHKPTEKKLAEFGLLQQLEDNPGIELRPRYSYFQFMSLTKNALFVITDGGSNQEECHYMGKPCIIMRSATERHEGLGQNAVISNYQVEEVMRVVDNPGDFVVPPHSFTESPSTIIVDELVRLDA